MSMTDFKKGKKKKEEEWETKQKVQFILKDKFHGQI